MEFLAQVEVQCPHCWEAVFIEVDTSQGNQELIEDCSVCCQPMTLTLVCAAGRMESVQVQQ